MAFAGIPRWLRLAAIALSIGAAAAPVHAGERRSDDPERELTRRQRCRLNPFDQWCLLGSVGASLGVASGGNFRYGLDGSFGTFPLPYLALSADGGFLRENLDPGTLNRYDAGLTARIMIPIGSSYLLVPGYRGGLFWYRDALVGQGTIHGPQAALSMRLGGPVYLGVLFAYQWVTFKDTTDAVWSLAPALTFAF